MLEMSAVLHRDEGEAIQTINTVITRACFYRVVDVSVFP